MNLLKNIFKRKKKDVKVEFVLVQNSSHVFLKVTVNGDTINYSYKHGDGFWAAFYISKNGSLLVKN